MPSARFPLGVLVATPGALDAIIAAGDAIETFVSRHSVCDWGELERDDIMLNNLAVSRGERLLSAYHTSKGVKLWIITEADRSATTVLLPSEY